MGKTFCSLGATHDCLCRSTCNVDHWKETEEEVNFSLIELINKV